MILSTRFITQHYVVDEITGIILALLVGKLTFCWLWDVKDSSSDEVQERMLEKIKK